VTLLEALRALDDHRATQDEWGDLSEYDEIEYDLLADVEQAARDHLGVPTPSF
jgi:hypothetical protein